MRKLAFLAAALLSGVTCALGGGIPPLPSSPTYSEPSQIIATLNAIINQLNGNALGTGGYAQQPGGIVSLGGFCLPAVGPTPLTCNAQKGYAQFSGVTVTSAATSTLVVNSSFVTGGSLCQAQVIGGTNAAQSTPFVTSAIPGTGILTVTLGNGSATSTGASTIGVLFSCIN